MINHRSRLESFFDSLAERLTRENAVSDILYAFLNSHDILKEILLRLMEITDAKIQFIEREYCEQDGRPDFRIHLSSSRSALIEVKLFDQQYHFGRYDKIKINGEPPPLLFLLGIQKPTSLSEYKRWKFISWEEFIKEIEKVEDDILRSFAHYLRKVTMMEEIKHVPKFETVSVLYINRMIRKAINSFQSDRVKLGVQERVKNFGETYSGYYYEMSPVSASSKTIYLYYGLVYDKGFQFWIEKRNNDETLYLRIVEKMKQVYHDQFQRIDDDYFLTKPSCDNFFGEKTVEGQMKLLNETFQEINKHIEDVLVS